MLDKNTTNKYFNIQRIYVKDISFEAPKMPDIFHEKWNPITKIYFDIFSTQCKNNIFEINLKVTVIAKKQKNVVFLCEVQQAGLFLIKNLNHSELKHCLNAYCPNILFPYARTCISTLVSYSSFPQLNLAPVNFDDIFYKNLEMKKNRMHTDNINQN